MFRKSYLRDEDGYREMRYGRPIEVIELLRPQHEWKLKGCDHEWSDDVTRGLYGTAISNYNECEKCGLQRREISLGGQRNGDDCDSITYWMDDDDLQHPFSPDEFDDDNSDPGDDEDDDEDDDDDDE